MGARTVTCLEALQWGEKELAAAGVEETSLDAWYLFSEASGISRAVYLMDRNREWEEGETYRRYREMIGKRRRRVPLQYITGTQEFMGLEFFVNPSVLIPRQDTEALVEAALEVLRPGAKVLDMCTGSGCIGLSLAKLGGASVQGADISGAALETAAENAKHLQISKIKWIQSDLFENIIDREFEMIVSNPPYIATGSIKALMPEVRDYEPGSALDGGNDGLAFYRRLAGECAEYLVPGGDVFFEIGCEQAEAVRRLLLENDFAEVRILQDTAGLDRVAAAKKK